MGAVHYDDVAMAALHAEPRHFAVLVRHAVVALHVFLLHPDVEVGRRAKAHRADRGAEASLAVVVELYSLVCVFWSIKRTYADLVALQVSQNEHLVRFLVQLLADRQPVVVVQHGTRVRQRCRNILEGQALGSGDELVRHALWLSIETHKA